MIAITKTFLNDIGEMSREYADFNIRKFAAGGPK